MSTASSAVDDNGEAVNVGGNAEKNCSSPASRTRSPGNKCLCGLEAPIRTSRTADSYGRRFLGCANYRVSR
jgi:hypothetical protein